ncbi:MAG: EAL domain-containing protein [Thermodesulfobacteriota bacterium]
MPNWFLESYLAEGGNLRRIYLDRFPFTVGRQAGLSLTLHSADVSRQHAEFDRSGELLVLRDLGSANGTYVNRVRIDDRVALQHGDIIHIANVEFRLLAEHDTGDDTREATLFGIPTLSRLLPEGLRELQELLDHNLVAAEFEAVVDCRSLAIYGYEVLGRGRHPLLPEKPKDLFRIAESGGLAARLSEVLRFQGLAAASALGRDVPFFVNTHPRELDDPERLLATLTQACATFAGMKIVLEIHEEAVTDLPTIRRIKEQLYACGARLAYDDFGAGQARLRELVEVPPDYLKFDMGLIADIDSAPPAHRRMVETLVRLCRDEGIVTLAEGVRGEKELSVCRQMGFDLLQGYLFS